MKELPAIIALMICVVVIVFVIKIYKEDQKIKTKYPSDWNY